MNTILSVLGLTVALFCTVCNASTNSQQLDFVNYGVNAETSASCPSGTSTNGWYVDRQFGSKCFSRQVQCDVNGNPTNTRECANGRMFINDNDATCYLASDSAAITACEITIDCGREGISVYIGSGAIWGQTDAPLQFGNLPSTDANAAQCQFAYSSTNARYEGTMSFDSTSSGPNSADCGATVTVNTDANGGDGINIKYNFMVKRYSDRGSLVVNGENNQREEEEHGAVVTREKCFMIDATCYYNPDGSATAGYSPSSPNALDEHDNSDFDFDMVPVDCTNTATQLGTQTVFVDETVCFRNEIITTWHSGINLRATKCWATPTIDPNDATSYLLIDTLNPTPTSDATFDWMCGTNDMYDTFSFQSFRFQNADKATMNSENSYVDQIYVHCDVNACDDGDTTSTDCVPHCPNQSDGTKRRRRAIQGNQMLPKLTQRQIKTRMFVIPKDKYVALEAPPKYHMLSDVMSMGIFAMGCVFAVVALGLFVVLKKTNNNMKYKMLNNNQ